MLAVGERYLDGVEPQCARMATAFSGGLGDTKSELCGALSGGAMVIGGLLGRVSVEQDDEAAIELAARYRERLLETFGYTCCTSLREKLIHVPGGLGSCDVLVERAAMLLMELLDGAL